MNEAETLPWLTPVADESPLAEADIVGGKAASLVLLRRHGLVVPKAFAVTHRLFLSLVGALPSSPSAEAIARARWALAEEPFAQDFLAALQAALATASTARWVVRSSFASEDDIAALAAGVFESKINLAAHEVPQAIRAVLQSALAEAAEAYAARSRRPLVQAPFAVLLHPFVRAHAIGHAAAEPEGAVHLWVASGQLAAGERQLIVSAVRSLCTRQGAYEVEWVASHTREEGVVFVQGRPYHPVPPPSPWLPQEAAAAKVDVERLAREGWSWDESHNPLPLSPAQQGLVALVADVPVGYAQKVVGGYLFYKSAGPVAAASLSSNATELLAELHHRVRRDLDALGLCPSLAQTLAHFHRHYGPLLGQVGHAVRAGREPLEVFLRTHAPAHASALPDLLRGVDSSASRRRQHLRAMSLAHDARARAHAWKAYVEAFGDEAQLWDVAAPTVREWAPPTETALPPAEDASEPASRAQFERARQDVERALPAERRAPFRQLLAQARACVATGEDDDALYAQLQAPVRRALLRLGQRLGGEGAIENLDDVFFLPLPVCEALDAKGGTSQPLPLREMVDEARALFARQEQHPPPSEPARGLRGSLRGYGTGGHARGRIVLHRAGVQPPADAILLARTLLPTELPLLNVRAIITERGGPLDHVAAQARERSLPAVVGVRGALEALPAGTFVHVDADAGVVKKLGS